MYWIIRNPQSEFHSDRTILYFINSVVVFIFSHTSPAFVVFLIFFDDDWHSDVGGMDFQCSFHLHFLAGLGFWTLSKVFISYSPFEKFLFSIL